MTLDLLFPHAAFVADFHHMDEARLSTGRRSDTEQELGSLLG